MKTTAENQTATSAWVAFIASFGFIGVALLLAFIAIAAAAGAGHGTDAAAKPFLIAAAGAAILSPISALIAAVHFFQHRRDRKHLIWLGIASAAFGVAGAAAIAFAVLVYFS